MQWMNLKRYLVWLVLIGVFTGVGYFGYDLYARYLAFTEAIRQDRIRAEEIAANRTLVLSALKSAGVESQEAVRGFWYTYKDAWGNENVVYFDPDAFARKPNLSDPQINTFAAEVSASERVPREMMNPVSEKDLPPALQFHNNLYSFGRAGKLSDMRGQLEKARAFRNVTAEQLWQLSYIYELEGDYAKRDELNQENCQRFKVRCASELSIRLGGNVVDTSLRPIEGASVSLLGRTLDKEALTDESGTFSIQLSAKPMEKIRVSAVKRNFSEGVASVIVIGPGKTDYRTGNIVLGSPITIVTVNTIKHTVTDSKDEARLDGSFVLRTSNSTYEIPDGAIVKEDGTPYRGAVDVYLYEFTRDTVPQNLITLDTFDQVMGYAGDLMQSFGMPYIQFFTEKGEELHVMSGKPMLLTYKIPGMQDLRSNTDGFPYGKLTDADMQLMIDASRGYPGFPITREFLIKNRLLRFPPFWVFDRQKGVWDNVGMRVLDVAGTIQTVFYTN